MKKASFIFKTLLSSFVVICLPGCFSAKKNLQPAEPVTEIPIQEPLQKEEPQVFSTPEAAIKIQTVRMPKKSFLKRVVKPLILPKIAKPKPVPQKEVSTPVVNTATPAAVDDTAYELFKRCVSLEEDKTLSWLDFCQQMSDTLHQEPKYKDIAKAFNDISTSTSIAYITYKLWWYTNRMPKNIHDLYHKYSKSQLIHIIHERIALNKK